MKLSGDLELDYGSLKNAIVDPVSSLPAFVPGQDEGRLIYVTTGVNVGIWIGANDGTASYTRIIMGAVIGTYSTVQVINNGVTFQGVLTPAASAPQRGFLARVSLSAAAIGAGKVVVEIHEDAGRSSRVYKRVIDLADNSRDDYPAYYESDSGAGNLYISITNLTGFSDTFTATLKSMAVIPVTPPAPPGAGTGINAGVAGDGVAYDGINVRLEVDLLSTGGLQTTGVTPDAELGIKLAPSSGLAVGGTGLDATGCVKTTTAQSIAGIKRFTGYAIAIDPAAGTGPPAAGTWTKGAIYQDSAQNFWLCSVAGTPGTWIPWSSRSDKAGGGAIGTYTGTVTAGNSLDVPLTTPFSRRGRIEKLIVWAAAPTFTATPIDSPFRVGIYPNSNYEGRERIGYFQGQARTELVVAPGAAINATVIPVASVDFINLDDLVRLRALAGPTEEYAAVTVRATGPPTIAVDENIDNALAVDDLVMAATEFTGLPWWNDDTTPANYYKLYLRLFNDDPAQDLVFGYEVWLEQSGGGQSV